MSYYFYDVTGPKMQNDFIEFYVEWLCLDFAYELDEAVWVSIFDEVDEPGEVGIDYLMEQWEIEELEFGPRCEVEDFYARI